jgi:ketosteroid isomerase-like protein
VSEKNVEIVRRIYAEWEHGNLAVGIEWFDPELTFETFMPDTRRNLVLHGVDEVEAFTRAWFSQWRNYRAIGDEFLEIGPDTVVVIGRQAATGHQSGVEVESPGHTVWKFRRHKVVRLSAHYDRIEALKVAGPPG